MLLTSASFTENGIVPTRHATRQVPGGENISIPYAWSEAPAATRSFALAVVDRNPVARNWVHWMLVDIPADAGGLPEGASGSSAMPRGARELHSTFGASGYGGPQPPVGTGLHDYEATLYALDTGSVVVPENATLPQFEAAVASHTLAIARLTGRFGR